MRHPFVWRVQTAPACCRLVCSVLPASPAPLPFPLSLQVTDGTRVLRAANGVPLLQQITATGCSGGLRRGPFWEVIHSCCKWIAGCCSRSPAAQVRWAVGLRAALLLYNNNSLAVRQIQLH